MNQIQIILAYEQHVCGAALRDKVSIQDCDASDWPALTGENLSQILWDMTIHAVFGDLRLLDMIAGARRLLETDGAYITSATVEELPDIWQAKLQGGSPPAYTHPDFKRWMFQAMAWIMYYCQKTDEDYLHIMTDHIKTA